MSTRAEGPTAGAKAEVGTNPPMGIIEFKPGIPIMPRLLLKSSFSEKIVNGQTQCSGFYFMTNNRAMNGIYCYN